MHPLTSLALLLVLWPGSATPLAQVAPAQAPGSELAGHWEGAYGRLGSIQTVMVDLRLESGTLTGTHDVPDLDIKGEPLRRVEAQGDRLTLRLTYGEFSMRVFTDAGEMTGGNTRWNPPLTLHLKRRQKPHTEALPSEEIRFRHGPVSLAGTLVKPRTPAPHPGIVIVHGSGDQGRHSGWYRFWGGFFARQGMATLIYDKRGVGASSGDHQQASFDDLAGDVVAAVEMLQGRPDIDASRIGIFGISQGGWLAPLAASRTDAVQFLILDVGPAVTVEAQELHRVEYSLRADEFDEADIQAALAYSREMLQAATSGSGRATLLARAGEIQSQRWAEHVSVATTEDDLEDWRRIRHDPAPVLRRTTVPLLALFGEHDVLVPPQENVALLETYLRQAGNTDATIRVIPGVGHDMETYGTLRGGTWDWPAGYWVWPRRSPLLYETITGWLAERGLAPGDDARR